MREECYNVILLFKLTFFCENYFFLFHATLFLQLFQTRYLPSFARRLSPSPSRFASQVIRSLSLALRRRATKLATIPTATILTIPTVSNQFCQSEKNGVAMRFQSIFFRFENHSYGTAKSQLWHCKITVMALPDRTPFSIQHSIRIRSFSFKTLNYM